jgi:hypothetical protein
MKNDTKKSTASSGVSLVLVHGMPKETHGVKLCLFIEVSTARAPKKAAVNRNASLL